MQEINTNPLGYWCAPNGATPEYVAHESLFAVLAFILMEHTGPGWAEDIQKHKNFREFVLELQVNTLLIFEAVLSTISDLEEAHDLDPDYTYSPDDFGANDYTFSSLMDDEDAEKDPGRQVEYKQNVQLAYNETEDVWEVRFDYGVMREDSRAVWWKIKQDVDGWMERYENELKLAQKKLAEAWHGDFGASHHLFREWRKLEVVEV